MLRFRSGQLYGTVSLCPLSRSSKRRNFATSRHASPRGGLVVWEVSVKTNTTVQRTVSCAPVTNLKEIPELCLPVPLEVYMKTYNSLKQNRLLSPLRFAAALLLIVAVVSASSSSAAPAQTYHGTIQRVRRQPHPHRHTMARLRAARSCVTASLPVSARWSPARGTLASTPQPRLR